MPHYATTTEVPVERSRAEVEATLRRYGADGFRYGWADRDGVRLEQIEFSANGRHIRFNLTMPSQHDNQFALTPQRGTARSHKARYAAWDQACRQRWRALALAVKAKLESVECGISEFESEFMAFIVDPATNRTVGEILRPQIEASYKSGPGRIGLPGLPAPE